MMKLSKRFISLVMVSVLIFSFFGIHFKRSDKGFAYSESLQYGNLVSVILKGGYSADYGNGIVYSDEEDSGKLYLRELDSDRCIKLSDKSASYINVIKNEIFFVSENGYGSSIVRHGTDSSEKILYSSSDGISYLYVNENGMYFLIGSQVLYYDFATEKCSFIYENEKMFAFVLSENGDVYWFEKKADNVSTASCDLCPEGTEDTEIGFISYVYDSSEGTSSEINFFDVPGIHGTQPQDTRKSLGALKLYAEVGDKRIPTEEYPVGSYFTDDGGPCSDHKTDVCGYETEDKCNCKAYYNDTPLYAVQCYGYARFLYYYLFGQIGLPDSKGNISLGTLSEGNVTLEAFKSLFANAKPGAQMRVTYYKDDGETISNHSMIILDWNEDGFSACESNLDGKCGTFVKKRTFDEYVPTLISVDMFIIPADYPQDVQKETTVPSPEPDKNIFEEIFGNIEISDGFIESFAVIAEKSIAFMLECFKAMLSIFTALV